MKNLGIMLLCCFLIACSSLKNKDKNNQSTAAVSETVVNNRKPAIFQEMKLKYPGSKISFKVSVRDSQLIIQPSGLSVSNQPLKQDMAGYSVVNAEIGDLNLDGNPEIFVYLRSAGSGSYGKLIGYSVNDGKSISQVYLPQVSENPKINRGYMGHDQMAIVESTFCLRFPIYNEADNNSNPTGGTRQIQYKLMDGESCKILEVDKVLEF